MVELAVVVMTMNEVGDDQADRRHGKVSVRTFVRNAGRCQLSSE